MRTRLAFGLIALVLAAAPAALAGDPDSWLHIRVDSRDGEGEQVRINLPLQLIESLLPMITADGDSGNVYLRKGRIHFGFNELDEVDLRQMLAAVRDAEDGEYITVQGPGENVRVAKEKGNLLVDADDNGEKVRVRVRMKVVEALLEEGEEELDLVAMVQALREQGEGELINVESEEETVRIWIDREGSE